MRNILVFTFAVTLICGVQMSVSSEAQAQSRSKTECTVREGVEFYRQKNYGQALRCWEETARHGNSAAQFNIARMYALGEGVPSNKMEAYKWIHRQPCGASGSDKSSDQHQEKYVARGNRRRRTPHPTLLHRGTSLGFPVKNHAAHLLSHG